jgi:hypothetical protein
MNQVQMNLIATDDDDLLVMEVSSVGPVQMHASQDGTMFLQFAVPIPAGMFKFQKSGGLVGLDGKPILDVKSGIPEAPVGRLLVRKSGISDGWLEQFQASQEPKAS